MALESFVVGTDTLDANSTFARKTKGVMMMYEELVKRLREAPSDWPDADLHYEAADAIEDLTAQLEKANEVIKADTNYFFELSKPKEKLA